MDKGYSISSVNGKVVVSVDDVKCGDIVSTRLKDGTIKSKIVEVNENGE